MSNEISFCAPVVIGPQESFAHTCTMIFLHGRSSSGDEISKELFDEESSDGISLQKQFPSWRWVFPTSLSSYNEIFRETMREWFNISSLSDPDRDEQLQLPGLRQAVAYIHFLIRQELRAVPPRRLFLGGISQGGAVALTALLSGGYKIGGFVILCGWMPFQKQLQELLLKDSEHHRKSCPNPDAKPRSAVVDSICNFYSNKLKLDGAPAASYSVTGSNEAPNSASGTPVFIGHSVDDNVVGIKLARDMRETLVKLELAVTWSEYQDAGHWISEPQGVDDIMQFLTSQESVEPNLEVISTPL